MKEKWFLKDRNDHFIHFENENKNELWIRSANRAPTIHGTEEERVLLMEGIWKKVIIHIHSFVEKMINPQGEGNSIVKKRKQAQLI